MGYDLASGRELGERIRRLRLVAGLGQIEFAQRVGVANGSVSKIENGRMVPSDDLVRSMASVLDFAPSYLREPRDMALMARPWLRAYADASKRAVDRQLADCATAVEFISVLGLRMIPETLPSFHGDLSDDEEIEQSAVDVRAAAQLGEGDVVGNTIRAAERLGCVVLPMREELGRHVGMSARSNLIPIICVSRPSLDPDRHVPGDRQRFTVAHELGHLALHGSLGPPESAADAARIERQAHRFAGAFLAPGDSMLDELHERGGRVTLRTLTGIKERWGIAIKALVMRFRSLDVIDEDQARSLYKQISARGWNKSEPVRVGNEQAIWLTTALERRSSGSADPLGGAAAASGIGVSHIMRWTDWSPTGPSYRSGDVVALEPRPNDSPRDVALREATVTKLPVRGR